MSDLVSCVCVTRGFPEHVESTIRCFEQQTYPHKELVVVHDGISEESVATFERAGARVFAMPGVPLGMLRNKAVEESRGQYVAQWDDDDLSAPDRIEVQLKALEASWTTRRANACVLRRYILWDERNGQFYRSFPRAAGWESSLVAERAAVLRLRYPPVKLSEDRQMMARMATAYRVLVIDEPDKYVYRYHGRNACSPEHFRMMFAGSALLSAEEQQLWKNRIRC